MGEDTDLGRVPSEPGSREPSPSVSAASGFDPSRDANAWAPIEYDDGYPEDEQFSRFDGAPLDFHKAAQWLLDELPRACDFMCCWCDITDGTDISGRPCKLISFSTGGWSGAESIIALIESRFDMRHFMLSWKRGGHYVFEIPARFNPKETVSDE